MKKIKQRLIFALTFVMLFTSLSVDVSHAENRQNISTKNDYQSNWAGNMIKSAMAKSYIKGFEDGSFKPDKEITRAEFVSIINRAFGYTGEGEVPFIDIAENAWYKKDVAIAYNAGYIKGISANMFAPQEHITREQACVIIAKTQNLNVKSASLTFADQYEIPAWAKNSVAACVNAGIISGYPDNTFKGKSSLTRAEKVAVIEKVSDRKGNTIGNTQQAEEKIEQKQEESKKDEQKKYDSKNKTKSSRGGGSGGSYKPSNPVNKDYSITNLTYNNTGRASAIVSNTTECLLKIEICLDEPGEKIIARDGMVIENKNKDTRIEFNLPKALPDKFIIKVYLEDMHVTHEKPLTGKCMLKVAEGTTTTSSGFIFVKATGTIIGYKSNEENVSIPSEIDGVPVESISYGAFEGKNLKSVVIPDSVTSIGKAAFCSNQLESLVIPNSVKCIREAAFWKNKLTSVTIPDSVKHIEKLAFTDNLLTSVKLSMNTRVESDSFDSAVTITRRP